MKTPEEILSQWLTNKIIFDASSLQGYSRGVYTRDQMARISRMFTPTEKEMVDKTSPFNNNESMRKHIEQVGLAKTIAFFSTQNIIRYESAHEMFFAYLQLGVNRKEFRSTAMD